MLARRDVEVQGRNIYELARVSQTELRKKESRGTLEKEKERQGERGRSKHEYSTTGFIRHFMHSRRALLCIHFYGLESDFLLVIAWGMRGRGGDGVGTEDGERWLDVNLVSVLYFLSLLSCDCHSLIELQTI